MIGPASARDHPSMAKVKKRRVPGHEAELATYRKALRTIASASATDVATSNRWATVGWMRGVARAAISAHRRPFDEPGWSEVFGSDGERRRTLTRVDEPEQCPEIGDVVVLRSTRDLAEGEVDYRVRMTVVGGNSIGGKIEVKVAWLNDMGELARAELPARALRKVG